jgi:hypothetical protein
VITNDKQSQNLEEKIGKGRTTNLVSFDVMEYIIKEEFLSKLDLFQNEKLKLSRIIKKKILKKSKYCLISFHNVESKIQ